MPPPDVLWRRVWGDATALLDRARRVGWIDLVILLSLAGIVWGLLDLARHEVRPTTEAAQISLSLAALPRYTFYSLCRGLLAFVISVGFTLGYGYWAAKDHVAEKVLIPLLDVLQSVPVLGFLPPLMLLFQGAFPGTLGLELVAIIMIFTGQVWNMTFSFYHSLRSIPLDQREVARVYRFGAWQQFKWLELPASMMGLVWNGMLSMAGGWFFLTICETYSQGEQSYQLPGLGSYMSRAADQGQVGAMAAAVLAMTLMVVMLDQFLWRPAVVWAQKFRVEEGGAQPAMSSWFLTWLRRSALVAAAGEWLHRLRRTRARPPRAERPLQEPVSHPRLARVVSLAAFVALVAALAFGLWKLIFLWGQVSREAWLSLLPAAAASLGRVLASTLVGTLWAVPAGLAIGLSPRLSRIFQPIFQVVAAYPTPMLFPILIVGLRAAGIPLGWGSILLMLLGTQWYILFNVIAGSMAIPADLREASRSYRLSRWQRFWYLYAPSIFPYLVTGWITAAGGAWNTTIVAEYVKYQGRVEATLGLGAFITEKTEAQEFAPLAAGILVMVLIVVFFNRTVWRRLYLLAEDRFSLNK